MDAKKHFWVDYLACLIFGAVIVPLWYYGRWPNVYCTTGFLLAVTLFAIVHVVCFWILGLFVRRKGARLFLLYVLFGFCWFLCPVLIKLSPRFLVLFPVLHAYRWFLFFGFSLLSAVFLIFVSQRCSGSSRLLCAVSVFVYVWFVIVAFFAWRNISSFVPYVYKPVGTGVNYPNIYHILLDAHANQEGMEQMGGNLNPFYRKLQELGFVTYPESKSVYTRTEVSVCAMWNMDAELHRDSLHNSLVWRGLSSRGYSIRGYTSGVFYIPNSCSYHGARLDFQKMISGTIWFHTFLGIKAWLKEGLKESHRFVLHNLECAKETYGTCGNFFYGHILSPHGPFVYYSSDHVKGLIDGDYPDVNSSKEMIIGEHLAIDSLVLKTINAILWQYKNESIKPIIVLHSDHGAVRQENLLGSGNPYVTEDTVYGNLLAIYMPDEWKKDAKDLKFINLYRFIFNHLFGTNYEYLPDVRKNLDGSIFKEKTLPSSEQ